MLYWSPLPPLYSDVTIRNQPLQVSMNTRHAYTVPHLLLAPRISPAVSDNPVLDVGLLVHSPACHRDDVVGLG